MKLSINPLDQFVARAERRINLQLMPSPIDAVHERKRNEAIAISQGADPSQDFEDAAEIEGKTVETLVSMILSKPDSILAKDNERRRVIMKVRKAKSASEIDAILLELGIPPHPEDLKLELLGG